ncbi:MAG: SMC family ATPase, partial [Desulfuromonadales bacterium]|nr:SMC family ATPase [Desulfuromonadales bacterium]
MQILSIHLKNIKSHRELDLDFAPGINVLSGANGVGKSTIFESIGYALFGVDAQSFVGNVDRFITSGAKRGEIAVVFLIDEDRYRVSRTVGTPAKWLLAKEVAGDFEVEEHKDAKETEGRLKELLGLDNGRSLAEQFELVIGPFQNEFLGPFVIKQATRRRDKFDEILGIDAWRKTYTETKVLVSTIRGRVDALHSAIAPLKDQVAVLPERREAYKDGQQQLAQTEQELTEKSAGLKSLEAQLSASDQREQAVQELTVAINALKERIGNGREKISRQKTLIDEAEKSQKIVAANSAGKQAFEQAEQRLAELREQVKTQRQLEQEVAALDKQVTAMVERHASEERAIALAVKELQAEEQDLAERRKALTVDGKLQQLAARLPKIRKSMDDVRDQIGRLDGRRAGLEEGSRKLAEGVCPFFQEPCLNIAEKPPGDVFSAKLTELEAERNRLKAEQDRLSQEEGASTRASEQLNAFAVQLKGLEEQAIKLKTKLKANAERASGLETLQKDQSTVQQQLDEKQTALKSFNTLLADIDACEALKTEHQTARDLFVANQEQAAKLEERQAELVKYEQLLARYQGELAGKEAQLVTASKEYDAGQHQTQREQKDLLNLEVGALGQKVTGLKADVVRLAGEIDKLRQIEQEIVARQAKIKAYGEKEELVKFLRNRVFNRVSVYLSERFREEISQRANHLYRIIAEVDEELAWGDNYRIVLRDMVDGKLREREDDQLSGGQTMSAVVALRLAMLQTIGARIAFFDEPTSNL